MNSQSAEAAKSSVAASSNANPREHLRATIRMLGDLLGKTIVDQEGLSVFESEEEIRLLAKSARNHESGAREKLIEKIANIALDLPVAAANLKAFSTYFQLVNLAEEHERVRVLRQRSQVAFEEGRPMDETIGEALATLKREGRSADDVQTILDQMQITPVFTAHPTESKRRTTRQILKRVSELLHQFNSNDLFERERESVRQQLHDHIVLLWQSDETRDRRPTVDDEVRNTGLYFFENTLLDLVPRMYEELQSALAECYPDHNFQIPSVLTYGSWIGGDRDGNPFVTPQVTRDTLLAHQQLILNFYSQEVRSLYKLLSVSKSGNGFSEEFLSSLENDIANAGLDEDDSISRFELEPYRQKLILIYRRLRNTLQWIKQPWNQRDCKSRVYRSDSEFKHDLSLIRDSLAANKGEQLIRGKFARLCRAVDVFGFHLATLDVRQHARQHRAAVAEVMAFNATSTDYADIGEAERVAVLSQELSTRRPFTRGVNSMGEYGFSESTNQLLELFRLIASAQAHHGERSMQTYIISMTQGVSDLLEVLLLADDAGLFGKIDIVPLFETVADLKAAPKVMQELFNHPAYARHLKLRGGQQQIMIGYSDSNKDGGYLQANWMLFQAQRQLAETCLKNDVRMTLFHGRGGSLGRGGGPTNRAILAQPPESVRGRIRITEQGEVVSSRYSDPEIAHRHLQQLFHAVLCSAGERPHYEKIDHWSQTMDQLSELAYQKYRSLIERENFLDYFQHASPIDQIGNMNIGSRPSHRRATKTLDDLRAIPWVFAWTQSRTNVPSWYGVGLAIETWLGDPSSKSHPDRLKLLQEMYAQWPFFRTLLGNVHVGLGRADMAIAKQYSTLAGEKGLDIFADIEAEYERSRTHVLKVTGGEELLHTEPWLQHSIRVRNPYVDPLNYLQIELLKKVRDAGQGDPESQESFDLLRKAILQSINGVAAGLQNVG